jgi:hypothetical protein
MPVPERDLDLETRRKIMADLFSVRQTSDNAGNPITAAYLGANALKYVNATSDAGRTLIVSVTKGGGLTHADLEAVARQLAQAQGVAPPNDRDGPDSFTIAGVGTATGAAFSSGVSTVVFLRVQGTGTPNLNTVSGATLAKVCEFAPAL